MIKINIKQLKKALWNYKTNDDSLQNKLINNLKKNKQIENLIIRELEEGFEVVNGNHRLDAMNSIGMEEAWCFNLGKITENEAKRIAVETNETRFESDNIKLAEIISDVMKDIDLAELESTMPYSEEELENFDKLLNFDWDQFEKKDVEFEATDNKITFTITVSEKEKDIKVALENICKSYETAELI